MFVRLAIFLAEVSPALRRFLWRWWYDRLARGVPADTWTFMNYGFTLPDEKGIALDGADETDRFCLQLYERVAAVELTGARVLEIGCGRGGGASFLARYRGAVDVLGLDFSAEAIAFCRRRHGRVRNLRFTIGDAERLALRDGEFDAVVNVESSHCYGDIPRFFREAARVLRPGGHFLFADVRTAGTLPALEAMLVAEPSWELVEREDITGGVVAALLADDGRKRRLIAELVPPQRRGVFGEFAALTGTPMFERFQGRQAVYHRFVFRKKA